MGEIHLPHCHCDNENKIINCMPSADDCSGMADIFKQLSDGSRLRILWMLCHLEECVSNIAAAMEMSDPAVSHHLKQLKSSGLVTAEQGKGFYVNAQDSEMLIEQHLRKVEASLTEAIAAARIAGLSDDELKNMLDALLMVQD